MAKKLITLAITAFVMLSLTATAFAAKPAKSDDFMSKDLSTNTSSLEGTLGWENFEKAEPKEIGVKNTVEDEAGALIYKLDNLSSFDIKNNYWNGAPNGQNSNLLKYYSSADGKTWAEVKGVKTSAPVLLKTRIDDWSGIHVTPKADLPAGTKYLKIEWPVGISWQNMVTHVQLFASAAPAVKVEPAKADAPAATADAPAVKADNPKTGDTSLMPFIALAVVAGAGCIVMARRNFIK
jgi:hypothetical protein